MILDWNYGALSQNPTQYSGFWFTWSSGAGGSAPPPVVVVTEEEVSGVRKGKKKPLVIRLSQTSDKRKTAEFLKEQLKLRHGDLSPLEELRLEKQKRQALSVKRREAKMRSEDEKAQEEKRQEVLRTNNGILAIIAMTVDEI